MPKWHTTSCHWNFPLPFTECSEFRSVLYRYMGIAPNNPCMRTDLLQYTLVVMLRDYQKLMCYTTGLLPKYASIYFYYEYSPLTNRSISWRDTDQPSPKEYCSDFLCGWCDDSFNWPVGYRQSRWSSSTLDAGYWSTVDTNKSTALPIGAWDTQKTIMDIPHRQEATIFGVRFAPSVARQCPSLGKQCCRRSNLWYEARKSENSNLYRGHVMYILF
jgi:hypothetical protein